MRHRNGQTHVIKSDAIERKQRMDVSDLSGVHRQAAVKARKMF